MGKNVEQTVIKTEFTDPRAKKYGREKVEDGYRDARSWQKEAFAQLKDEPYMMLNAPMGSGKSWSIKLISAYKMRENARLRTIIAVPQDVIANGFGEAHVMLPCGQKLHWQPMHDLCGEKPASTISYVLEWLSRPHASTGDRVLICTHATIGQVYRTLKETKKLRLLNDVLVWIDECHHLKNSEVENAKNAVVSNGIGEFAAYACRPKSKTQLGVATATFFRGDRRSLLTDKMLERFAKYTLYFDEHLKSMNLKSFTYKFMLVGPDYVKGVEKILKSHRGKYFVYIPHPQSRHATRRGKYHEVEQIENAFKKAYGGRETEEFPGLTKLKGKNGEYRILDLVDEKNRPEKKAFTRTINESPGRLDAIIALGMAKEGFDWIYADRSIIVGPRGSLTDAVQTIGRLFRDAPGKDHVEVIHLLPFTLDSADKEKHRIELNDYLKAIYGSMVIENVFAPIKITLPSDDGDRSERSTGTRQDDVLARLVPDLSKQEALINDAADKLMKLADEADEPPTTEECVKVIESIVAKYGIKGSDAKRLSTYVLGQFARKAMMLKGIDVREIDFNLLRSVDPIRWIVDFASKATDHKTLRELRSAIVGGELYATWEIMQKHFAKMRAEGKILQNEAEYHAYRESDGDWNAVIQLRGVAR